MCADVAQTKAREDEYELKPQYFHPGWEYPGADGMAMVWCHLSVTTYEAVYELHLFLTENCQHKYTHVLSRWIIFVGKPVDFPFYSIATILFAKSWELVHWQAAKTFLGWNNRYLAGPATFGSKKKLTTAANINIYLSVSLTFKISLEIGLPMPHFVGYLLPW